MLVGEFSTTTPGAEQLPHCLTINEVGTLAVWLATAAGSPMQHGAQRCRDFYGYHFHQRPGARPPYFHASVYNGFIPVSANTDHHDERGDSPLANPTGVEHPLGSPPSTPVGAGPVDILIRLPSWGASSGHCSPLKPNSSSGGPWPSARHVAHAS